MIRQSELRRAVTAALSPVVKDARSSDDILKHVVSGDDIERINGVMHILHREGMCDIAEAIAALAFTGSTAEGKCLSVLLDLEE